MQTPPRPHIRFLSTPQCEQFDAWARRILTEKGWRVESPRLREELESKGCEHLEAKEIVRPAEDILERFLAELKGQGFGSSLFCMGNIRQHWQPQI